MQLEFIFLPLVNGDTQNVCRQQVAGELDSLVVGADNAGQGMGKSGVTDAGYICDQQVAAGQQAAESQADLLVFPQQNGIDGSPGFKQSPMPVSCAFLSRNDGAVHIPLSRIK